MRKYKEITRAREVFALPERATMQEIQARYRELLREWHPDTSKKGKKKSTEMTGQIVDAYKVIMDYCKNYEFSFSEAEVRYHLSEEDWWFERFGKDPVWQK